MKLPEDLRPPKSIKKKIVICPNTFPTKDPNQILSLFSEILREYNVLETGKENCLSLLKANPLIVDVNNNETKETKEEHYFRFEDDINNNTFANNNERFETSANNSKSVDSEKNIKCGVENYVESECSCICDGRCPNYYYNHVNGRYICCCTEDYVDRIKDTRNLKRETCSKPTRPLENVVVDISASIRKTFDTMYLSRSNVGKSSKEDLNFTKKNHQKSDGGPITKTVEKERCECDKNYSHECDAASKLEHHPLLIMKDQGLMEVHITCLQLFKTAARLLFQDSVFWKASFFISWDIRGQKTSFTPVLKYPNLNFDSSSIFVVSELFNFLDYIFNEYITFQVHVLYPNETTHTIAQSKLCVKEILDYPHNKMEYVVPVKSVIPCSSGENIGQLSLWVRLSCDLDKIKAYKTQRGIVSEGIHHEPITRVRKRSKDERDSLYSSDSSSALAKKKKKQQQQQQESKEGDLLSVDDTEDKMLGKEDEGELKAMSEKIIFKNKELDMQKRSSILEVVANVENIDDIKAIDKKFDKKPESKQKMTKNSYFELSPETSKNIGSRSTSDITEIETSDENVNLKVPMDIRDADTFKEFKDKITRDSSDQVETEAIAEFNKMLSNSSEAQADSSSTLRDVNEVFTDDNWDKYRAKSLENTFGPNTGEKNEDDDFIEDGSYSLVDEDKKMNRIIIEISSITLFPGTSIFLDPNISQLYIEYSFLGYFGEDMESRSVLIPKPPSVEMNYHFRKEFRIDEKTHSEQRRILRNMLNEVINPNIQFNIVSEPLPGEEDKECKEIGFALLNLKDYVVGNYSVDNVLLIMSPDKNEHLGILRITVEGFDAMKSL